MTTLYGVWYPFAIEISAETVIGLRKEDEKAKSLRKKPEKIVESKGKIVEFAKAIVEDNLELSHHSYLAKIQSKVNEQIADPVSELEKIYEKTHSE